MPKGIGYGVGHSMDQSFENRLSSIVTERNSQHMSRIQSLANTEGFLESVVSVALFWFSQSLTSKGRSVITMEAPGRRSLEARWDNQLELAYEFTITNGVPKVMTWNSKQGRTVSNTTLTNRFSSPGFTLASVTRAEILNDILDVYETLP